MPLECFQMNCCQRYLCTTCSPHGSSFANTSANDGAFSCQSLNVQLLLLYQQAALLFLLVEAIWRCFDGHEVKAVPGLRKHAPMLPQKVIWRCFNGHEVKAVPGLRRHVPRLLREAIWRCCNGHEVKAVPGMNRHVPMLPVKAIWKCCNGHEATAVPGMSLVPGMIIGIGGWASVLITCHRMNDLAHAGARASLILTRGPRPAPHAGRPVAPTFTCFPFFLKKKEVCYIFCVTN